MSKPYTVIGYWADDDEPVSVGVVEGDHAVLGGDGATEGGDWATSVVADSPEDAESQAVEEMRATFSDDEEDEDDKESVELEVGATVAWTDPDGGERSIGTVSQINGEIISLEMNSGGETEALSHELTLCAEGDDQ